MLTPAMAAPIPLPVTLAAVATLIAAVSELRTRQVPNVVTLPLLFVGMAVTVWSGLYFSPWLQDMQIVRLFIAVAAGGLLYPLIMFVIDRATLFEIVRLVGSRAPLPGRVKRMLARAGSSPA